MAKQFFVEPSVEDPDQLVWVDGFDAATVGPAGIWGTSPTLASWAWDSTGINVTREQAEKIAADWGTSIPA